MAVAAAVDTFMKGRNIAMGKCRCLLIAVTALACGAATNAFAEIRVEGNLSALRVSISGDALSDVLSALGTRLPVTYRTGVPLSRQIDGAYSGSFSQVIARLLDGYNYIIKNDQKLTEIIILDERGDTAVPPKAPLAKGILSRWR
jgi:hypothetical protein